MVGPARGGRPLVTCGMLAVLAAIFAVEHLLAVPDLEGGSGGGLLGVSVPTLIALGGLSRSLVVDHGEWHRLLTSTVLHGDLFHLALNGVALYLAGDVLEALLGRAWIVALFLIGAAGGALASVTLNSDAVVSVGASGAIMGLLAAGLVVSLRLPRGTRGQVMFPLVLILVPSLIPLAWQRSGGGIDFAAHLGGALAGAAAGLGVLGLWPEGRRGPRLGRAALALSAAAVLLYGVGIARAEARRAGYADAMAAAIIPNDDLRGLKDKPPAALLARYPRDPRARLLAAAEAAQQSDLAAAEEHLRKGLAEEAVLRVRFPDRALEAQLRALLAEVLRADGREAEAAAAARPACTTGAPEIQAFCN